MTQAYDDPDPAPIRTWRRRSPGRIAGGVVLTSLGGIFFWAGLFTMAAASTMPCTYDTSYDTPYDPSDDCTDESMRDTGTALTVLGVAGVATGIPLIVSGAKRVPWSSTARTPRWARVRLQAGPQGIVFSGRF